LFSSVLFSIDEGYWSLVRRVTNPNSNPNPNRPNVVLDLRNKKTLNSFSYVHTVTQFRNTDYSDPLDQLPLGVTKHRTGRTGPKYWSFSYEKG